MDTTTTVIISQKTCYSWLVNFRINVRAIIPHENKILLAQNKNLPGFWALPGGGLEKGESLKEGMRRELLEETGIEAKVGRILFIQQIGEQGIYNFPEFFFLIENAKDFINLKLTETSHGNLELEALEFHDVTKVPVLPEFLVEKMPLLFENNFSSPIEYIVREI